MARIILPIRVEVAKPNFFQAIVAKQNDTNSRWLKVTFVHNKEKIEVAPDSIVFINAKRSDGESKSAYGEVHANGDLLVPFTSWMLELAGTLECDVSVVDRQEEKLTCTKFTVEVEKASNGSQDVAGDENYDVLISALAEVAQAKAAITEAADKATTAASNATKAVNDANTAVSNANKAVTAANTAASNANTATSKANTATDNANTAANAANAAASSVNTAKNEAATAANNANAAASAANVATGNAMSLQSGMELATETAYEAKKHKNSNE